MRRASMVLLLLAGCATSSAPRAQFDSHDVGPNTPTNPNRNDPLVYTHIEGTPGEQPTGEGTACGGACAADEICDTRTEVHRCVKRSSAPAWAPTAQPASSGGR